MLLGDHTMFPSSGLSAEWLLHTFSHLKPPVPSDDLASFFPENRIAIEKERQPLSTMTTSYVEPDPQI